MQPTAIDKATAFIKQWEGCKLISYKDVAGIYTIGYGSTGHGICATTVWTQEQADKDLEERVKAIHNILTRGGFLPALNDNQLTALISLCYNIGQGAFRGSTLIKKINQRDFKGAALEFLKWNHVGGQVVDGLTKRRKAESELFLAGMV